MTATDIPAQPTTPPLPGKRVYAAGVIAAYTALANMPVGFVLYGINLQARGDRLRGRLLIAGGIICGVALVIASLSDHVSRYQSRLLLFLALFSAFCLYKFEKQPVRAAIRDGAILARWWPPALYILGVWILLFGIACFLP